MTEAKNDENKTKRAPCPSCRHYFISWNQQQRHGCSAFNFKSATLPCHDVRSVSSIDCLKYEARAAKK